MVVVFEGIVVGSWRMGRVWDVDAVLARWVSARFAGKQGRSRAGALRRGVASDCDRCIYASRVFYIFVLTILLGI